MSDAISTHCEKLIELKLAAEKLESELKIVKDRLLAAQSAMILMLESSQIDSIKKNGWAFHTRTMESVALPKTREEKELFYAFLKEKGIFEDCISVHSKKLSSLYRSLSEEALNEGILDFRIPGLPPPGSYKTLVMSKKGDKENAK
jgi:hypothetical protein